MMKSGIKKAEAHWKEYNSPKAKEARFMKKAMQQARNGTLKYGKLTDAQVQRVTDRLYLERQARQLGSTENPTYARRLRSALGEGVIRGIGMGTASYIDERFKGRGQTTAAIKRDKRMAKYEAKDRTQERRALAKQTEEFYRTAYEEGDNPHNIRYDSSRSRSKYLAEIKAKNKREEARSNAQKAQREAFDRSYYAKRGQLEAEKDSGHSPYGFNESTPKLYAGRESYSVTRTTYNPPSNNVTRKTLSWNRNKGNRK
jgi:hypothetical protein